MKYSTDLINKIILFICCVTVYICQSDFNMGVVPVLVAIIFSCLLSYFEDERLEICMTMGFAVLCFFIPSLTFFMPLIGYDMLFSKYRLGNLITLLTLFEFWKTGSLMISVVITSLLAVSLLLRLRTQSLTKLQTMYNNLRDTTKEMSIQLKKQNNELLEKQDADVNLATLNERNRIAREIHDNVGHLLSSAILQVGALLAVNRDDKLKDNLINLNNTLSKAMNSIRQSVHNLYDESIDLHAQIEELLNHFTICDMTLDYQISGNPDKKLKYAFIFIVKEALSNIMKHSNATHGDIILREHPALYQLIIKDNGTMKSYSMDNGMGLRNMTDRVYAFNGNINILTDNGFEIFISIPREEPKK